MNTSTPNPTWTPMRLPPFPVSMQAWLSLPHQSSRSMWVYVPQPPYLPPFHGPSAPIVTSVPLPAWSPSRAVHPLLLPRNESSSGAENHNILSAARRSQESKQPPSTDVEQGEPTVEAPDVYSLCSCCTVFFSTQQSPLKKCAFSL